MKIRNKYSKYMAAVIFGIFILPLFPETGTANNLPFSPGEKLIFEVKWSFIVAGEATLEMLPNDRMNDLPACHFLFTANTSPFADVFYKVRDRIESYTDIDLTHALFYYKFHKGQATTVYYDWNKKEAQYIKDGEVINSVQIEDNTFDPLSVFYAFRAAQPDKNNEIIVNVTDGKRTVKGIAKTIKKEKIRVAGNLYNTVLIEPQMEGVGGVFEKTKDAKLKIWVTDDHLRIPVRIKSKVTVGSFVADLVSYTSGSDADSKPIEQEN